MKQSRAFRALTLFFLVPGFCASLSARQMVTQQQPPRPQQAPLGVHLVRGSIYEVTGGSGANAGFMIGEREVFVIDAKMTGESASLMLKEIQKVTSLPVRRVLLTHSDGDHVNGLVGFPVGIDVIAHENTRKHVAAAFQSPEQRKHLPTITFTDKLVLFNGPDSLAGRIELLFFGPAHTDGDAIVFFPREKVAFVGDLLFLSRDPLIHRSKNGSSVGLVRVLNSLLALDVELMLSGHNEAATKDDVRTFVSGIEEKQIKIAVMVKEGKSLDDVKRAFQIDTGTGQTSRWPSLVEVIYREITEKQ